MTLSEFTHNVYIAKIKFQILWKEDLHDLKIIIRKLYHSEKIKRDVYLIFIMCH